ncbi:MAG: hypothetical protein H6797_03910 [Candidatus Nomurabacteria bacterium]|nr:MAG: hypothetical protein H6797_03910 [Candidatus Nomurabacteria bacterium]
MEHLLSTLTSPSVDIGFTLQLWILLPIMAGIIALAWRYRHNQIEDKICNSYKRGYREGLSAGYTSGKEAGLNTFVYQDMVDKGLAEISLYLNNQP